MDEENKMKTITRAFTAIRECNKALLHGKDESDLISKCCDIMVNSAGYNLAWIGITDNNDYKTLRLVAHTGFKEESPENVPVAYPDDSNGQDPTKIALKTGSPKIVRNILEAAGNDPLRADAVKRGYASFIALPIIFDDLTLGLLNLYAIEPDAFDKEEGLLLNDLASNLAYGITAYRINEERKQEEGKLQVASMLFENSMEGVMVTNTNGVIESVNPTFTTITGYSSDECIGKNSNILRSDRHSNEFFQDMWNDLLNRGHWRGEIWNRNKKGGAYLAYLSIVAIKNSGGKIVKYASVFHDITDSKKSEEQIRHQAYHDALTELPNRLLFIDRLTEAISRAKRGKSTMAVLFLDLDNFKNVNDLLGHATGDLLLKEASGRLMDCCRDVDTVARIGGDEFIILMENLRKEHDIIIICRKIIHAITQSFSFKGEEIYISTSIGISLYPNDSTTVGELMKNADMAMYHAKEMGRGNYQFFKQSMNEQVVKRLNLEKDLRRAVEKEEMIVYYQPKVNAKTGFIVGMEALMRWMRPDGVLISPGEFIPLAEETGLIVKLDDWMLKAVCSFARKMKEAELTPLPISVNVSVNLSAIVLERKDLVETVKSKVNEAGLLVSQVELEVTESSIIKDVDHAIDTLQRLRDAGFNVSMDDFGTGYSSLSYLTKLPINILKIDRAFVTDLPLSENAKSIARAVITMAHDLHMKVIAEGVETRPQLDFLREIDCDEIQGYFFSPPIPQDEIVDLLKKGESLLPD